MRRSIPILALAVLAAFIWPGSASAKSTLNDWRLSANWPVNQFVAYDTDVIRFAWIRTNRSSGGHVEVGQSPDESSFMAGPHFEIAKAVDQHVSVFATQLGYGQSFWRACTDDSDGTSQHCSSPRIITVAVAPVGYNPLLVDFCADDLNNDEDLLKDDRDPGCHDDSPLTELITSQPRASIREARSEARTALTVEFGKEIEAGYRFRLRCGRLSRARFKCRTSWVVGDLNFRGTVAVSIMWKRSYGEFTMPYYRMRIKAINRYCESTGGPNCIRDYRRRG